MAIQVTKIKKTKASAWYILPTPFSIQGGSEVLDSSESGRDNNTGYMYRDVVRSDVANYTVELPFGIDNKTMAEIRDIVTSKSFNMYIPDVSYGGFPGQTVTINGVQKVVPTRNYYCASFSPVIDKVTSEDPPKWTYEAFSFKAVEL